MNCKPRSNSLRQAAKALGISAPGLSKAVRAGRVKREPDGAFDIEKCKEQLGPQSAAKRAAARDVIRIVCQRLEKFPAKMASFVLEARDAAEVKNLLQSGIHDALLDLREAFGIKADREE